MRFTVSSSRSTFLILPCLLLSSLLVSPTRADEAADWTALIALRKQIGDDTFKNRPQEAVDTLQKFYESRQLDPILAGEVVLQVAEITRTQLGKPDQAMQMLEAGWLVSRAKPDPAKPVAVMYLDGQAAAFLEAKKPAEAKKLLADNFPTIELAGKSGHPHLEVFASRTLQRLIRAQDALRPAGQKPEDTISVLQGALTQMPVFFDPERQKGANWQEGWMYEDLIKALSKAGRDAEALSWGKLFFAEVAYDKGAIERATRALGGVWAGQDDLAKVRAFAQAQAGEAQTLNPLDEVKLPTLDDDAGVVSALKRLRQQQEMGFWRGRVAPIITLEIARGNWQAAMEEAQELLKSDPGASDGPQQIARVFKAKDGDIARANVFLSYLEGKAPNPMPAFFAELDAKGVAQGQ